MAKRLSRDALAAFQDKTVPDIIGPNLRAIFCGINPSLSSAADRAHFATPGNRFWPSLARAGFTPQQLSPGQNVELLKHGLGVTNLVARATASAAELNNEEYPAGVELLEKKCRRYKPQAIAMLGIGAFRTGFGMKKAKLGPQDVTLGPTRLYVLPNPSGLNAHYSPDAMAKLFIDFKYWLETL